jgi:thiamine phosphate synthase YjbQ (UPF0047 family)
MIIRNSKVKQNVGNVFLPHSTEAIFANPKRSAPTHRFPSGIAKGLQIPIPAP